LALYTASDLEIGIATMNRENLDFLKAMFKQPVDEIPYQILIVNQSKKHQLTSDFPNIKVINDVNFGLSRSRNLAIENTTAKILWFLDDDCEVLENAVHHIVDAHNQLDAGIITFVTIADSSGLPFWNYPNDDMLLSRKQRRKGYVKSWSALLEKYRVFNHGMNDYLSGFEGHRNGHPDL